VWRVDKRLAPARAHPHAPAPSPAVLKILREKGRVADEDRADPAKPKA